MISSNLFSPKYLLEKTDLRKVGLFSFNKIGNIDKNQKEIYLSLLEVMEIQKNLKDF